MKLKECSIDGCQTRAYARGWCSKHYTRWRNHGDPMHTAWEIHGKIGDKWRVRVTKDGTTYHFGVFENLEDAKRVAERARADLFAEFAGKG